MTSQVQINKSIIIILLTAALCIAGSGSVSAAAHYKKNPYQLHAPDERPCTLFVLHGVSEADPAVPGSPWFALPNSHQGQKEIFSILLSALLSGKTVNVRTSGGTACGAAEVIAVGLNE